MDTERKALRAQALLNDELLKEAFLSIERDSFEAWKQTSTLATKRREQYWHELKSIERVKAKLQKYVSDWQLEKLNK